MVGQTVSGGAISQVWQNIHTKDVYSGVLDTPQKIAYSTVWDILWNAYNFSLEQHLGQIFFFKYIKLMGYLC